MPRLAAAQPPPAPLPKKQCFRAGGVPPPVDHALQQLSTNLQEANVHPEHRPPATGTPPQRSSAVESRATELAVSPDMLAPRTPPPRLARHGHWPTEPPDRERRRHQRRGPSLRERDGGPTLPAH